MKLVSVKNVKLGSKKNKVKLGSTKNVKLGSRNNVKLGRTKNSQADLALLRSVTKRLTDSATSATSGQTGTMSG